MDVTKPACCRPTFVDQSWTREATLTRSGSLRKKLLIKCLLISKCRSHYWGSLLLFSFDAKNISCMLRDPVLDPISPFSFYARVFSDFPLFDWKISKTFRQKGNDWAGPKSWNLTSRAGYITDAWHHTEDKAHWFLPDREVGGWGGGGAAMGRAVQWQVNEGEKCWLAYKSAAVILVCMYV